MKKGIKRLDAQMNTFRHKVTLQDYQMTNSRKSYSRRQSQYSPIHNQKNYSYHTLGDHVEEQEEFQSFSKRDLATLLSTAEGNFKDQKK